MYMGALKCQIAPGHTQVGNTLAKYVTYKNPSYGRDCENKGEYGIADLCVSRSNLTFKCAHVHQSSSIKSMHMLDIYFALRILLQLGKRLTLRLTLNVL